MKVSRVSLCLTLAVASFPAATDAQMATAAPSSLATAGQRTAAGYLLPRQLPDSVTLLPPPPAPGSTAQARDDEGAAKAVAQQGTARWTLATADALLSPASVGTFSCAAGFALSPAATPAIAEVLRRASMDFALSTIAAKRKYQRARPFMVNGKPNCTPAIEAMLRKDGSYPSGHSALGFGQALILAEVIPSRATELVARGRVFGDSKRLCNVHWLSDIEEGRIMAAATLARLHAEPAFRQDIVAARAEADAAIAAQAAPARDCASEAATIATTR